MLLSAARFTTRYVRLVGQEPAPSKCVLLSTSREVRKDMKGWVLSQEEDRWSVKFDVRDLGGHLDTTFRGWSSTLAARVRLVISRYVLIFVLPLDFHGRVRVVRSMYLPAALHGIEASFLASESLRKLRFSSAGWFGLVVSLVLELCLACWMGQLGVILHFVWHGFGFVCFVALWPAEVGRVYRLLEMVGEGALGMVLFIFFPLALLRLDFGGTLMLWLGLDLVHFSKAIWLALLSISRLPLLMLGVIRLLLTFVDGRVFQEGLC